jgi:hypothetical protein
MTIDQEFNCLGYFGFGNGISIVRKQGSYCNGCFMAKACWALHRTRCQLQFPDLCAHIDKLGREKDGQRKIMAFIKERGSEPYMNMMMGNIEDAMHVLHTGKPKDRGPYTLTYPFEKKD